MATLCAIHIGRSGNDADNPSVCKTCGRWTVTLDSDFQEGYAYTPAYFGVNGTRELIWYPPTGSHSFYDEYNPGPGSLPTGMDFNAIWKTDTSSWGYELSIGTDFHIRIGWPDLADITDPRAGTVTFNLVDVC